jgi:hypothetical protein
MTLLDGLDLSAPGWIKIEYVNKMRAALEAALAVIEALDGYGQSYDLDSELQRMEVARSALTELLKPFRKEGLG